jgi:hypothetical protein
MITLAHPAPTGRKNASAWARKSWLGSNEFRARDQDQLLRNESGAEESTPYFRSRPFRA